MEHHVKVRLVFRLALAAAYIHCLFTDTLLGDCGSASDVRPLKFWPENVSIVQMVGNVNLLFCE